MAAATALSPLQTLRNLFGSQTPSKPSVPIHCPTYHSRPLPLPNPATKLTDPASSTSAATTLSDDKHRIIVGARMTNAELLSDDSTATTSIPKRIIINASGKIVEYQFPAGRLTIKEEPPDVLLVRPDVDPQILRHTSEHVFVPLTVGGGIRDFTDGNGRYYSSLEVASEYFWSGADKVSIGSDAVFAAEEYLRTGVKTGKSSIEQISQRYGNQAVVVSVDPRRVYLRSPNEVQFKAVKLATPGPLGEEYAWYQCTVDYFGDAGSPLLNYIDGIQARSSYLTVGGGLGINHYNGGNIPPMLMDLNNTACDFVPSQGGPLMIEHTNRIFRRMCCSHQILWISLLMAGSLLLFHPCIRSIIKIIISFIHSSDGNYIKLDTLMSLMQFFGLGQSCAPLFCSVGITSETRKSPFKLLIMMMGAAWWLLGSFKGSKHDVNSALVRFKDNLATQQIPPPNTLLQLKFFLDFVTSGGGCTQISLFMVAIFHGKLFTVLAELFTVLAESSFWKKNLDQHLKLCFVIPKDSKLRDRVFMAKTIADIQNHGEGKYNDQLHVLFDPVISSRESALLTITCKLRAKNDDEYKASISDLQLIVEGGIKDALLYHGEAWPVQYFV